MTKKKRNLHTPWHPALQTMREDENFAPYCMECPGLRRMVRVDFDTANCSMCGETYSLKEYNPSSGR